MHNFSIGQEQTIKVTISPESVEEFIVFSGDSAPLHTSNEFAKSCGFSGKIVHGAALLSFVSKFVGLILPGPNSLWLKADVKFHQPCYAPTDVTIHGRVTSLSPATSSLTLDINVNDAAKNHLISLKSYHKVVSPDSLDAN